MQSIATNTITMRAQDNKYTMKMQFAGALDESDSSSRGRTNPYTALDVCILLPYYPQMRTATSTRAVVLTIINIHQLFITI